MHKWHVYAYHQVYRNLFVHTFCGHWGNITGKVVHWSTVRAMHRYRPTDFCTKCWKFYRRQLTHGTFQSK